MAKRHGKPATGERTAHTARVLQPVYAVIGERLREARMRAGLSQIAAAGKLAMTAAILANIERGAQRIQIHDLAEAAKVYEADAGWLLGGEAPKPAAGTMLPEEAATKVEVARMLFGEAVARLNEALGVAKKP